jgi:hypothetical protein
MRWRDGAVSRIFGSLLRRPRKARLFEIRIIQGLIAATFSRIEELVGVGTLRNGAGTLAKLDLIDAVQAALAKML